MSQKEGAAGPGRPRLARERVLAAASRRFYSDGITATGIDTITAEAGVARMSLYNNFSSKAELVRAYLEARHEKWLAQYRHRLPPDATPRDGVLAVFDSYIDSASAEGQDFRGCGLLNAAGEMADRDEVRELVRRQKDVVEGLMAGHLAAMLPDRPDAALATAEHLALLLEGAMIRAGLERDAGRLRRARALAENIVDGL